MAYTPRNYQTLRDDHQKALEALDQHIETPEKPGQESSLQPSLERGDDLTPEQDNEPTRPETMPGTSRGWTGMGDMPSQQTSAINYNMLIIADLESRSQSSDRDGVGATQQDTATAVLSNDDYSERGVDEQAAPDRGGAASQDMVNAQQSQGLDPSTETDRDGSQDSARAWLTNEDGIENEISQQPVDRESSSHEAALKDLQEHIERGESGDRGAEFRDAARETGDRQPDDIGPDRGDELAPTPNDFER